MLPFLAALLASSSYAVLAPAEPAPAAVAELADPLGLDATEPASPGFDLAEKTFVPEDVDPAEYGKWHGSVSLGATIADGNTERTTFSAMGKAENRREKDRRTAEILWNYAKEGDDVTDRRLLAIGKYDYFATEKLYYLGQLSGEYNKAALLDLRVILALGLGYQFKETEVWKFAGEGGLAYVDENYEDDDADGEFAALRLAYKADYVPNETWIFGQVAELYPSLEDSDDITARVDTHAKCMLSEKMFAQAQWLYTWDNTPAAGAHHVDHLILLMIGWSF